MRRATVATRAGTATMHRTAEGTIRMDQNSNTFEIREGMDVIGSDGETLGSIDHFEGDSMVVKGGMFSGDQLIPISAVTQADANQAYLGVTSAAAMNQQWTTETSTTMGSTAQTTDTTQTWGEPAVDTTTAGTVRQDVVDTDVVRDRDDMTIELAEEELTARKRAVDRGEVTISKNVVAEEQTIDVPVTEEQVSVSRRAVDRDVAPGDQVFEGGTIEVPVRGEEAVVEKTAHVAEEIEISKDVVQETERVTDTVRREEVQIDDSTVTDGTTTSSQTGKGKRGGRRNS